MRVLGTPGSGGRVRDSVVVVEENVDVDVRLLDAELGPELGCKIAGSVRRIGRMRFS